MWCVVSETAFSQKRSAVPHDIVLVQKGSCFLLLLQHTCIYNSILKFLIVTNSNSTDRISKASPGVFMFLWQKPNPLVLEFIFIVNDP